MIFNYDEENLSAPIAMVYKTEDKKLDLPSVCDNAQLLFDGNSNNMMVLKVNEDNFTVYVLDIVLTERIRLKSDESQFMVVTDKHGEPVSLIFTKKLYNDLALEKKII